MSEGYKWHNPGSRKGQIHRIFDERGYRAAYQAGLGMGLKADTLRTWLKYFPIEDERFSSTGRWQAEPANAHSVARSFPGAGATERAEPAARTTTAALSESAMEDQIAAAPEEYLREPGLRLVGRQVRVGPYIFDLMFTDRHGGKLIVELQKGTLDRNHLYKILDYYDAYKERNPAEFVDVMVIANVIPVERKRRLDDRGIAFRELPFERFVRSAHPPTQNARDLTGI